MKLEKIIFRGFRGRENFWRGPFFSSVDRYKVRPRVKVQTPKILGLYAKI